MNKSAVAQVKKQKTAAKAAVFMFFHVILGQNHVLFRILGKVFSFFRKKYRKIIDFYVILLYNTNVHFFSRRCAFLISVRSELFSEKASGYRI